MGNFYTGQIQGLQTVNVEDSGLWGYYAELQSYSERFYGTYRLRRESNTLLLRVINQKVEASNLVIHEFHHAVVTMNPTSLI
jgi:hypothetical protein